LVPDHAAIGDASLVDFDIPSQSLALALEHYAELSGRQILYDSNLSTGRISNAAKGRFTAEQALSILLTKTGLTSQAISDGTVVLKAEPDLGAAAVLGQELQRYYGRIQLRLRDALCASHSARPGSYRAMARFWIGSSGDVVKFEQVGSTGSDVRDAELDHVLQRLKVGEAPPRGFLQPVTIEIVPQAANVTMGCAEPAHRDGYVESAR
jgi:hypothetical protein